MVHLNRPKIHNRLKSPSNDTAANSSQTVNNHVQSQTTNDMRTMEPHPPARSGLFPKLNPSNANARPSQSLHGQQQPHARSAQQWSHAPVPPSRPKKQHQESYVDDYENMYIYRPNLQLPDIQDKVGTATRRMRAIKTKPKQLITLEVVDNGEYTFGGQYEKNKVELPSISGYSMALSPRSESPPRGRKSTSPSHQYASQIGQGNAPVGQGHAQVVQNHAQVGQGHAQVGQGHAQVGQGHATHAQVGSGHTKRLPPIGSRKPAGSKAKGPN